MGLSTSSGLAIIALCIWTAGVLATLLPWSMRLRWGHTTSVAGSLILALAGGLTFLEGTRQPFGLSNHLFAFASFSFVTNHLSGLFLTLIGIVGFFVALYTIGYSREYVGRKSIPLLVSGIQGFLATMALVVLAANVFSFLFAWECMAIVSFLLVMYDHERRDIRRAGFLYAVMTHLGTVFITIAFLILAHHTGSFSFSEMFSGQEPHSVNNVVFLLVLVGFGMKAGLVPLHIWLPRAHPVAPSPVSALMSGLMIKTAIYGFLMVIFHLAGSPPLWWGLVVCAWGAVTALVGIILAVTETDHKRMLAYSSVENMGLIFLGAGTSLIFAANHLLVLSAFALTATLVHVANHAMFKSLLFLGSGAVLASTHTQNMNLLGGLLKRMPWTGLFVLVGALSIAGMPSTNGFTGEWMMFQSLFGLSFFGPSVTLRLVGVVLLTALSLVSVMVALAFVRMFAMTFLSIPRSDAPRHATEASLSLRLAMGGLAFLCLALGVIPDPVLSSARSAVSSLGLQPAVSRVFGLHAPGWSWSALPRVSTSSSPVTIGVVLLILVGVLAGTWLLVRIGSRGSRIADETWACGISLEPRMTPTASGFSKPIRILFQAILRPTRQLDAVSKGASPYFPIRFVYVSRIPSFAERRLYRPVVWYVLRIANAIRLIQDGRVQSYLAYLLTALIVVLILVR